MDITVRNLQSKFPIPASQIKSAVPKVIRSLDRKCVPKTVAFVFVGPKRMQSLNKAYLGHDYVTDVITFNLGNEAEIIICPRMAAVNAREYGIPLKKEIMLYAVHGILHLAGYDDHHPNDIKQMRLKEQELLKKIHG